MSEDKAKRILLVEDIEILRANYQTILEAHHFSVCGCGSKAEALDAFAREAFDVVILDVTLGADYEAGFELCQAFRTRRETTPIVFLTERDEDPDRISGLRLGADDYLTKTVSAAYLVARINALIRRVETLTKSSASESPRAAPKRSLMVEGSDLQIDDALSVAYWQNKAIDLSLTQFWILADLAKHAGSVRSIEDLMEAANITVQPNTIVAHIKTIREKIQKVDPTFGCIKAERARGYRWLEEIVPSPKPSAD
ncbi:MAG: response regulator [Geminicoccaceae bacterium]